MAEPTDSTSDGRVAGRRIGPYRVVGVLGQGGMGVVYLAEQEVPVRRRVALKVLAASRGSDRHIARMEAERQALALMNHPSIATVYDAGTTADGLPYFAMEVVEGAPLVEFCDARRLGLDQRLDLFVQICDAVEHAHQKMVIHRDLKPSNVLVTMEDGRPLPKLIDFGIAKGLEQPLVVSDSLVTREGLPLGTPMYMSPEQIERGAADLDARTDVYALGVLLFELLVGVLPLDLAAADTVQTMIRVLKVDYPRMSARFARLAVAERERIAAQRGTSEASLRRALASDLEWVVMKAVEKDRRRRYSSVGALRADIIRFRRSEPVQAHPPSTAYRVSRFMRRYRLVVTASVAVVIALATALAVAVASLVEVTRARDEARLAEARATTTVDYLRTVLASVDPGVDGRQVRVVDVLAKATAMLPGDLEGEPLVEAAVRKTIGLTLLELGLFAEAGSELERAVRIQTRELGPGDAETLDTVAALGRQLYKLGRYEQAAAIHRQVLEEQVALLGHDDPAALWSRYHLAKALHRQGRFAEAEAALREVVDVRRTTLGPRHLDTLIAANGLGLLVAHRGRFDEAERTLTETIAALEATVGADHPDTLRARVNLAELLNLADRPEEADGVCRAAVRAMSTVLGREHPETLSLLSQQAFAVLALGQPRAALALGVAVLRARRERRGEQHPDVYESAVQVAISRLALAPDESTERALVAVLEAPPDGLPADSWQVGLLSARAGRALLAARRCAAAERCLRAAAAIAGRDHNGMEATLVQLLVELGEVRCGVASKGDHEKPRHGPG